LGIDPEARLLLTLHKLHHVGIADLLAWAKPNVPSKVWYTAAAGRCVVLAITQLPPATEVRTSVLSSYTASKAVMCSFERSHAQTAAAAPASSFQQQYRSITAASNYILSSAP